MLQSGRYLLCAVAREPINTRRECDGQQCGERGGDALCAAQLGVVLGERVQLLLAVCEAGRVVDLCEQGSRRVGEVLCDVGPLAFELFDESARPECGFHPFFEKGFGGLPQIQIRVEHAPEAFDVEQCFLQQNQLWLHGDIELARDIKQSEQRIAE